MGELNGAASLAPTPGQVPLERVAVVGLGLIGGSLAQSLVERGIPVTGWDPDAATREEAREKGITVPDHSEDLAGIGADLAVLAGPLRAFAAAGQVANTALYPGGTLTDVGSVKGEVRRLALANGWAEHYVGAHPMAGTEQSGFPASSAALLPGATWAVTLNEATQPLHAWRVLSLIVTVLGSPALTLTDDQHDRAVALISHAPHVVATSLLSRLAEDPQRPVDVRLAAGSFRDGTRVARTDPERTAAMVTANAAATGEVVRRIGEELIRVADALAQVAGDPQRAADLAWFFRQPDPARRALADKEALPAAKNGDTADQASATTRVSWDDPQWAARLLAAGADGRAVVGVDTGAVTLEGSGAA